MITTVTHQFVIKHGRDHQRHRYVHEYVRGGLNEAITRAAQVRRSYAGIEGAPIFVWVEDRRSGKVVYGEPALRPGEALRTYRLPAKFWHDHHERDLPEAGRSHLVREVGNQVLVEMDALAVADLRADAVLYTDPATAVEMGLPGLARSAASTLAALDRQTVAS